MILPSTYAFTIALLVLGMLCWGSWASLYKAAGKLRFELFYFDFAIGVSIFALITAFTVGTLGFDGFSFMDDILHAAKKQDLIGMIGGAVFNLGNMLLLAAVSEIGMAVAFPVGLGTAIVIGAIWSFLLKPNENLVLLIFGLTIVFVGVVVCSTAYRFYNLSRVDEQVRTGQLKSTRRRANSKGTVLAIIAGVLIGCHVPLVTKAMEGEVGVGPYSLCVVFALGVFLSTFLYNLFLMNLPISGAPIEVFEYFKSSGRQHLLGIVSGGLWIIGLAASLVAAAAEGPASVNHAVSFGLTQGAIVIAVMWGILVWKELPQADGRVRSLLLVSLALLVCGIGLVAVAPVRTGG